MRYLAILSNLFLLGMVVFLFATEGAPEGSYWLIVIIMAIAPLFSLVAILGDKGDNWLFLYFKRKALEEKRKIDQLSENQSK